MAKHSTKRTIRSGYLNFRRSGLPTASSIVMMMITLSIITFFIYSQAVLTNSLERIKDKVDVTVYFIPGTSEDTIANIENDLKNLPEVKDVTYTSADDSIAAFKEKHANDYLTLQALNELSSNPLGASLKVKAKDPSQYESISNYFSSDNVVSQNTLNVIDKIDYSQNKIIIDKLNSIIDNSKKLGFAISLIFIIVSIFITYNTLRLMIFISKEDISTMKLVGASKSYIRGPFIVSGIFIGAVASIFTIVLFLPISIWISNAMSNFLGIDLLAYYKDNFFQLFLVQFISAVVIGSISSYFAIHRYLRKK